MIAIHHMNLPAGTRIGVYEIKDTLKVSSFDITYRAWNHHFKDWVVLLEYFPSDLAIRDSKSLHVKPNSPADAADFEYGLKAFVEQAEVLSQIEHANVRTTENYLFFNDTAYVVMRDMGGVPLSELDWSYVPFTTDEFRKILITLLQALQKLHDGKIIHGGIQPASILLSKDGNLLLTEFCGARIALASRCKKCSYILADGYAPIEQYEEIGNTGITSDFYSLAATFYYCMTHQQPVAAQDRINLLNAGEADPMATFLKSTEDDVNIEFTQMINRMLSLNQRDRPQTDREILAALKMARVNEPVDSHQVSDSDDKKIGPVSNLLWITVLLGVTILTIFELLSLRSDQDASQFSLDSSAALQPSVEESIIDLDETEADGMKVVDVVIEGNNEQPSVSINNPSIESPQSELQQISAKPVSWYLDAAQIAINELRLTTPAGDNAYEYLQQVLAVEPDNDEARLGLQKMLELYIQMIKKAWFDGQINTAQVYLLRAESILPDSPELERIRAELFDVNE